MSGEGIFDENLSITGVSVERMGVEAFGGTINLDVDSSGSDATRES